MPLAMFMIKWKEKTFVDFGHLSHPVKNPSPCHIEDLGGGILAVLLRKQGHLQLQGKVDATEGELPP